MHTPHASAQQPHARLLAWLLLLAGLLLRVYFVQYHAFVAADSILYQDIAHSWLHKGIYGFATATSARPTLIRLPGYPIILAVVAWVCDPILKATPATLRSFEPLLWLQVAADLATCWMVRSIAQRIAGERAGLAALALACLCPFTANYTAVPLTEAFTLFFLTMAFLALQRWLVNGQMRWTVLVAVALSWSILLRPDQGLLAVAVLPVIVAGAQRKRLATVLLCAGMTALPFVPWTMRNYRTFHVFQPLAPKQAVDPGEAAPLQFQRWFRTWGVDFSATQDAYWNYPEDAIDVNSLPQRAFDTQAQRARTVQVLEQAAAAGKLSQPVEDGLGQLAKERIAAHPFRYYIALPAARLVNMLFHPRTEMLPVDEYWWQYKKHPGETIFACCYGLLNLGYVALAMFGFRVIYRRQRLLALSMAGYIVLRCILLMTLDNAEQRYTLELFPLLIVFGSGLWNRRSRLLEPRATNGYIPVTL